MISKTHVTDDSVARGVCAPPLLYSPCVPVTTGNGGPAECYDEKMEGVMERGKTRYALVGLGSRSAMYSAALPDTFAVDGACPVLVGNAAAQSFSAGQPVRGADPVRWPESTPRGGG